jgi:predicted RNA binding protein YcfA (HicA-like mRNA interferase family)
VKLPRDLSGSDLAKKLVLLGYSVTRQTGSHIRLTTMQNGQHHITVPEHDVLKVGTLSGILHDIAAHHKISKDDLIQKIF